MAKDAERKAFKDYFDAAAARSLAAQVARVHPSFDARAFEARATRGLKALAFAARVRQFSDALRATLPDPPARHRAVARGSAATSRDPA